MAIDPHDVELAELMLCRCGRPTVFRAESVVCPTCGGGTDACDCEVVEEG